VSTFTQTAGALAAVAADWVVATDLEVQGGTATANIQYVTANVYQHNDALGLKASAVGVSDSWALGLTHGIVSTPPVARSVRKYSPRQAY
jgi:hypothetical protein